MTINDTNQQIGIISVIMVEGFICEREQILRKKCQLQTNPLKYLGRQNALVSFIIIFSFIHTFFFFIFHSQNTHFSQGRTEAIFDDTGVNTETSTQSQKNNCTFLWMLVLQQLNEKKGFGGKKNIVGVIFSAGSGLVFHSLHNTFGHSCAILSLCCRLSNTYTEVCGVALLTRALPLALYTLLVTHMRYHLFVWTVFSPKLLYEGMLTVVMSGFCGACLWMAGALKKSSIS